MKMEYHEFRFRGIPEPTREILMAELSELGFESFLEEQDGFSGYIPASTYEDKKIIPYLEKKSKAAGFIFEQKKIKAENWNAVWESQYHPVLIEQKCLIRAPFHDPVPGITYDILIEPKMSFGTGHHETTSLMIGMMMKEQIKGKRVLDMGCGTGILSILALKMNAGIVYAIDTDEWAFRNAKDNIRKNIVPAITVIMGDVHSIPEGVYDLILANINRNVLIEDIPVYARHLSHTGILLLSGFYLDDLPLISARAEENRLKFIHSVNRNQWVAAKYCK